MNVSTPTMPHAKAAFWASLAVCAMLVVAAFIESDHAYYGALRLCVCAFFSYATLTAHRCNWQNLKWAFGFLALLFNPFLPPQLDRGVWIVVDALTATFIAATHFHVYGLGSSGTKCVRLLSRWLPNLFRAAIVVIGLFLLSAAGVLGKDLVQYIIQLAQKIPDSAWTPREVAGLIIDSPAEFTSNSLNLSSLDKQIIQNIESNSSYRVQYRNLHIGVAHFQLKSPANINLEQSLDGMMQQARRSITFDSTVLQQVHPSLTSGGLSLGLHANGRIKTLSITFDALVLVKSNALWTVAIVCPKNNAEYKGAADRVYNSVSIKD